MNQNKPESRVAQVLNENKKISDNLIRERKETKLYSISTKNEKIDDIFHRFNSIDDIVLADITETVNVRLCTDTILYTYDLDMHFFKKYFNRLVLEIEKRTINDKNNYLAKFCFRYVLRIAIYEIFLKIDFFKEKLDIRESFNSILSNYFGRLTKLIDLYSLNHSSFDITLIDKEVDIDFRSSVSVVIDSVIQMLKYQEYERCYQKRNITTHLALFKNYENILFLEKKHNLLTKNTREYFNLFKLVMPMGAIYAKNDDFMQSKFMDEYFGNSEKIEAGKIYRDTDKLIFEFGLDYGLDPKKFVFPDIDKYRENYKDMSSKKVSIAVFHRFNALASLRKICDRAEQIGLDLKKCSYRENKFIGTFPNEEQLKISYLNIFDTLDSVKDFITDIYNDPLNAEYKHNKINTDYLSNPLGRELNNDFDILGALYKSNNYINKSTRQLFIDLIFGEGIYSPNTGKYYQYAMTFFKKIIPTINNDKNYEAKPYGEFISDSDINLKSKWLKIDDWIYILDVMILCSIFNIERPKPSYLKSLLKYTESDKFRKKPYENIEIRFNYTVLMWISYFGEYVSIKESKSS